MLPASARPSPVAVARDAVRADVTLRALAVETEGSVTTVRFGQRYEGVPVWGAQSLVHLRTVDGGQVTTDVAGHVFDDLTTPSTPAFDEDVAADLVALRFPAVIGGRVEPHGLTILPTETGVLTYHFTLWGKEFRHPIKREVFVNARTGAVAFFYDNLQSDGPVVGSGFTAHGVEVPLNLFERGSIFEMRDQSQPMFLTGGGEITTHDVADRRSYVGTDANIVTADSLRLGPPHRDSGAVDAHFGAQKVYEYYLALGRDSIDGNGGSIVSSVNATENGGPLYNAFWDGDQMVYGNPDPSEIYPLSADLDVVGHELTHGVTQHSGNLAYINQSGAMNEAYSDYFGNAIDVDVSGTPMDAPGAGEIGEDLCKVPNPSQFACPIRDMNDGMTTDDFVYYLADFDSGGVHLNSTIYSGALWDIREALGGDKADPYIYRALTSYTTPLDDFIDGRNAVVAAAQELGATPEDLAAINAAFDGRGVVPGWDNVGSNDSTILLEDIAPVGTFFSPPQVSGKRFIVGDYTDQADICCEPVELFVGNVDGSGRLRKVGEASKPSTYNDETPDISGRRAVWTHITLRDVEGFDADIHMRTLGGRARSVVKAPGFQLAPSIDGKLLAWEDQRGRNPHVWAKRLGGRSERVSPTSGTQMMAQASGDWVAWWDVGSLTRFPHIGLKNIRTGRRASIRPTCTMSFGEKTCDLIGPPGLSSDHVYWYQDSNPPDGRGSIRRAKLDGTKEKVLVRQDSRVAPVWFGLTPPPLVSTSRNYITYSDEFGYAYDFFVDDPTFPNTEVGRDVWVLRTGRREPFRVTNNIGDQAYPVMAQGTRVLWLDSSRARTDLMTKVLP